MWREPGDRKKGSGIPDWPLFALLFVALALWMHTSGQVAAGAFFGVVGLTVFVVGLVGSTLTG